MARTVPRRGQRFDFKRIGPADIRARLDRVLAAEGVTHGEDALAMIARAADGSMRDAPSLTDQVLSMGDGTLTAEPDGEALWRRPAAEFPSVLDLLAGRGRGDVFSVLP